MTFKIFFCLFMVTLSGIGGVAGFYLDNEWYMRAAIILASIFLCCYMILSEIEALYEDKFDE